MTDRGAFAGPINRAPGPCYDCGADPGQRHAERCALSPLRWARVRKQPAVWGPLYFNTNEEGGAS